MSKSIDLKDSAQMTFWEHVDVFRKILFRCLGVWAVCSIVVFCFKEPVLR